MFPQYCDNRVNSACNLNKLYLATQLETRNKRNINMYKSLCCSYELLSGLLCALWECPHASSVEKASITYSLCPVLASSSTWSPGLSVALSSSYSTYC